MAKSQDDFMTTLSYLLGERTVPSTGIEGRKQFVQDSLNEVYRAYPWQFAKARTTLTVASGIASLPSNFDGQHKLEAYTLNGDTDINYEEVDEADRTGFQDGDKVYWIEAQSDGTYHLRTKDSISSIIVTYQSKPPIVTATVTTPFDDTMTVALGAKRYVKSSQDPNADIAPDEALFQKRLLENISATQVHRPTRKLKFASRSNGYRIGGGYE